MKKQILEIDGLIEPYHHTVWLKCLITNKIESIQTVTNILFL